MFAIKKHNETLDLRRFGSRADAEAAFTPSPFGHKEIVKASRPCADHEFRADFGIETYNQALRVAQKQTNRS